MIIVRTILLILILFHSPLLIAADKGPGKVYLVLGSDTAIWDGMLTSSYHCYYNVALYTDVTQNAYKVMDATYRNRFKDSYGTTMKLTWWMMAGNIFRYADNTNVSLANTMTLYLMRKYHGESIKKYGDELSLHYHTFTWTDYNGDGKFYWNQAKNFLECRDDFDVTMAQYLLEENTYPVSFRSGWHAMDNEWQNYLDDLLPYCMHNNYPAKRVDLEEPIDNIYDWSKSSPEFIPFHPSRTDYQLPGDCRGWNLRSKHIAGVNTALMDTLFARANRGIDQVACLWGHLPETDFLDNLAKIDSLAHRSAAKYTAVQFLYCSAVEAMQRWRKSNDFTAPQVQFLEDFQGDNVSFLITTDEPIFQRQPFVAVKDKYERYTVAQCQPIGNNMWRTVQSYPQSLLAKAGVAVIDTMGNLTTKFLLYVQDDLYIDNNTTGYNESYGQWIANTSAAWGTNSRTASVPANDSAKVVWLPNIQKSGYYNIFVQVPQVSNPVDNVLFRIYQGISLLDTVRFLSPLNPNQWIHIGTVPFDAVVTKRIEMVGFGGTQGGKVIAADVIKISPLVRDKELVIEESNIVFGAIGESDTARTVLTFYNRGIQNVIVNRIGSSNLNFSVSNRFPIVVPPMTKVTVPVLFYAETKGVVKDTLSIESNDPINPVIPIPFTVTVTSYFAVSDNEDSLSYLEYGNWYFSNAWANGKSSRYSWLRERGSYAQFIVRLRKSAWYDIQEIVPKTANASLKAKYILSVNSLQKDSVIIDQNAGSGSWVTLMRKKLDAGSLVQIKVIDVSDTLTSTNVVLRADAIRFQSVDTVTSVVRESGQVYGFALEQNYPNPFNSITAISYQLLADSHTQLKIIDVLGREVVTLVNEIKPQGRHTIRWNADKFPSGVYFYQLRTGGKTETKRMILMR